MIYATEFGCDPTGQTPCAAQMQQFLNAVRGKEGRIPPGTYKIESELYFGYDCSAGSRPSSLDALGGRLIGGGCANTALLWAGTTGSTPSAVLRVSNPRCYVEGIKVAPLGTNKPDVGLVFQDAEQAVVKDVWVYNTAEGSSLAASQVQAGFLWDTTWKASNTTVPTNVDMRLVGCEAESCWRGYFMRTSARAQGVMLECCSAKANGGHGFHVFGTSLAMYFCRAKQNGGHALRVGISGPGIAITS
ncbi:MAG TPA: hypothetical protein VHE30_00480, partial [Polyangiaceae bacterium]|nr:hypothetical protein [Polyangiaceae bacterium]